MPPAHAQIGSMKTKKLAAALTIRRTFIRHLPRSPDAMESSRNIENAFFANARFLNIPPKQKKRIKDG